MQLRKGSRRAYERVEQRGGFAQAIDEDAKIAALEEELRALRGG